MNRHLSDDELATAVRGGLDQHLAADPAPPGALARVRHEGLRLRRAQRRRRALAGVGGVAAAVVLVAVGTAVLPLDGDGPPEQPAFASLGPLDFSEGLRAYAAPGEEIHLGGRIFPWERMEGLDTDAAATPYGIVHFPGGVPHLLREDGQTVRLEHGEAEPREGFHPTAKADAIQPWVAYTRSTPDGVVVTLRDLAAAGPTGREVASRAFDCGDSCGDVWVDAVDGGLVFLRMAGETSIWDAEHDSLTPFSGRETRVADVRAGVVLYDGKEPSGPGAEQLALVQGSIDAQLTHDGRNVLGWSPRLEPVRPHGQAVVLEQGDRGSFYTVDTDGSVLVAVRGRRSVSRIYDCEVPSGECTELGVLDTRHGDPMFVGNDM